MTSIRKSLKTKSCKELSTVDFHVFCNIVENRSECAYLNRVVIRNGDAVFGRRRSGNADMASGLPDR